MTKKELMKKSYMKKGFQGTVREYRDAATHKISPGCLCASSDCTKVLRECDGYYCDTTVRKVAGGLSMSFFYYCPEHGAAPAA